MSDRKSYYFKQAVTESELNGGFDDAENADRNLMVDQQLFGIFSGGTTVQHSGVADLTVDVGGPMKAYDPSGERILIPASVTRVDCSQDSSLVSTAVAGGGNEKWVSLTAKFTRTLSDPRVDGNSVTVYFVENESFQIIVAQGAEAALGTAPRPTVDPDGILIVDIHRTFGQTQILNADIDITRRQDTFVLTGSPLSIRAGTPKGAVQAMLNTLNTHVTGGGHPASAITTTALGNWADGSHIGISDAQSVFAAIVADLAANTGATLIGAPAHGTLGAGQLSVQLAALEDGRAALATAIQQVVNESALHFLNWRNANGATKARRGAYSSKEQAWYAVGATGLDVLVRSGDAGRTWVDKSGGLGASEENFDIAFDDSGNAVILVWNSRNVYSGSFASFTGGITWTHVVNALTIQPVVTAPLSGPGGIVWDGTHTKFVAMFLATGGGIKSNASLNTGLTWTAHALPAAWDTYAGANIPELASDHGTIIGTMLMGTTPHVVWSTDGGTTWTDVSITPNTVTPSTMTKAVYSANDSTWYLAFCDPTSAARQSEIWKSTNDGATWTLVVLLAANDFAIDDLNVLDATIGTFLGSILIGFAQDGRIYYSIDKGLHWRLSTQLAITTAMRMWQRSGGGQLVSWNSTDNISYASNRLGLAGKAIN